MDLNPGPSVPVLGNCLDRPHYNNVIVFISLDQWSYWLRKRICIYGQIAEEISVLLKRNIQKVLADLNKNLPANHGRGCGNGWYDFSGLDFDLVEGQFFDRIILGPEIRVKSNKVNMAVLVIVFLHFQLIDFMCQRSSPFDLLNKPLDCLLILLVRLRLFVLVQQVFLSNFLGNDFFPLDFHLFQFSQNLVFVAREIHRDDLIENFHDRNDEVLMLLIFLIKRQWNWRSLRRSPK